MRTLLLALVAVLAACGGPPAPEVARAPGSGTCDNGAILDSQRAPCASGRACVLGDKGPRCVAEAEAEQREPCGMISCGSGCTCASEANHECLCPLLGSAAK